MAKILVMDDEQSIRCLLDKLLSRKGYEVILAASGRVGLEVFRRDHPDGKVLDLKMPEMEGIAVLQQIRLVNQKIPVIVLTAARILEMEQQVHASGVTEFIEKEFSLHHLADSLKRHLNTAGTAT
jgi:DNA-binding NtrC family response regulator